MYQQITLVGNLGRDPEMRYTPTGLAVTNFSIAVSKVWTGQDGQQQKKTTWFRVTAWRNLAEQAARYTKGMKLLVVGELEEPNAYIDKEGKPRASLEITAHTLRALSGFSDGNANVAASGDAVPSGVSHEMHDEDIPF